MHGLPSAYRALIGDPVIAPPVAGPFFHNPARPCSLFTSVSGRRVEVTLRLFGRGSIWSVECEQALPRAIQLRGLSVAPLAATFARPQVDNIDVRTAVAARRPPREAVTLTFDSPVALNRQGGLAVDLDALVGSICARAASVLGWSGFAMADDDGAVVGSIAALSLDRLVARPQSWARHSMRQGRVEYLTGLLGQVEIRGVDPAVSALLDMAQVAGIGSHTTVGMGRFSLS